MFWIALFWSNSKLLVICWWSASLSDLSASLPENRFTSPSPAGDVSSPYSVAIRWLTPLNFSEGSIFDPTTSIITSVTASASYNIPTPFSEVYWLLLLRIPNDYLWKSSSLEHFTLLSPLTRSSEPTPASAWEPWIEVGLPTGFSYGLSRFSWSVFCIYCGSGSLLLALPPMWDFEFSFGSFRVWIKKASWISFGNDWLNS